MKIQCTLKGNRLQEKYRELTRYIEFLQMLDNNSQDKIDLINELEEIQKQVIEKILSESDKSPFLETIKMLIIPVDLTEYCGKWMCRDYTLTNGNDVYFEIINAGGKYYITFDDANATLHELVVEEEDVFLFYIGEQWHKLCVNTSAKELTIVSFNDYIKRKS